MDVVCVVLTLIALVVGIVLTVIDIGELAERTTAGITYYSSYGIPPIVIVIGLLFNLVAGICVWKRSGLPFIFFACLLSGLGNGVFPAINGDYFFLTSNFFEGVYLIGFTLTDMYFAKKWEQDKTYASMV